MGKTVHDLRNSTFTPQICRKSEAIASKLFAVGSLHQPSDPYQPKQKPEDRLLKTAQQTSAKLDQLRQDKVKQEKDTCTFKPRISKTSHQIAQSRSLGRGTKRQYESLYEEATQREEILEKQAADFYSKVCTFRPKINPPPAEIAERIAQVDFMERGQQQLTKREAAQKASAKVERRDPEIGNKTGRRPPNLDIHEYLYGFADKQKKDLEELQKSQAKEVRKLRFSRKDELADKVVWEAMDKKLATLFTTFDVDGDG